MGVRFLATWQDTNGCRHFVGGNCNFTTPDEAQRRIEEVLASQKKDHQEHKVIYEVLPYEEGQLEAAKAEYRIAG